MYKIFEQLAKNKGVTMYFVAKETGVPYATLSAWKNGRYHPKDDKMQRLAYFFGVPLDYLKGKQDTMQCPECHMDYSPIDERSLKAHEEFHKHFLDAEKHYCMSIPSREVVEQKRVDALLILRDIAYDKHRRISAFHTYTKYDFLLLLYENNFDLDKDLDQHAKELAEKFRPDRGISLDLCNAVRAEFGVDEYRADMSINITAREYRLIQRYREQSEEAKGIIDKILEIEST